MRISVINDSGKAVYSEIVDKSEAAGSEQVDFAKVLSDEADKMALSFDALSSKSTGAETMSLEDMLVKAANTYDIDVNYLKAVAKLESNFNPDSVSSAGAVGIMQLMPSTAQGLGVDNLYDPYQNIMGGAKYLRQMLDRFDGSYELAYAAYNAGPGAVSRAGGIPNNNETPKAVALVMKYYNEGVSVPNRTYTIGGASASDEVDSSAASKAALARELSDKLKEFPNQSSYEFFVEKLKQDSGSASDNAKEDLLSKANLAIRQILSDNE